MEYAAKSHIGLVRQINEDEFALHMDLGSFHAVLVADGMGGHMAGEVASSIAVEVVGKQLVEHLKGIPQEEIEPQLGDLIVQAILRANEEIYHRSRSVSGYSGMGTTIVASIIGSQTITMGYIGDSRGYLITEEGIRQLTDDHSLVNELYKSGQLTEEEAHSHPQRNIITRALGTDLDVKVDLVVTPWRHSDVLLLCTDGLTDLVTDEEIQTIIDNQGSLDEKIDQLVQMALEQGGKDNITIVALQNTVVAKEGETQ